MNLALSLLYSFSKDIHNPDTILPFLNTIPSSPTVKQSGSI